MKQISLLPTILIDEQPADPEASKDLLFVGFDEQGRRYAIKTSEPKHPLLPLVEWLCYHLCNLIGIPTPDFAVVTRLDGSLAFGSRWEENAREFSPAKFTEAQLITWLKSSSQDVSGIFCMDAFMPNEDRHLGNFLFVQTGPRLRALAFDWSRTHLFEPWPWQSISNSQLVWHWLKSIGVANMDVAASRMDRLQGITSEQVLQIVHAAPDAWKDKIDISAISNWWQVNREKRAHDALELLAK